jgi:hypothetical protein
MPMHAASIPEYVAAWNAAVQTSALVLTLNLDPAEGSTTGEGAGHFIRKVLQLRVGKCCPLAIAT